MKTTETIRRDIETALGEHATEHDVNGFADQIWHRTNGQGTSHFDTDTFWALAPAHALDLTVTWAVYDDTYNAAWEVSTEASGMIDSGTFAATEDVTESEMALAAALAQNGYRLGSEVMDRGDVTTYGVSRIEE